MPFFMVDDHLHANAKVQLLVDMGQTGVAAIGLWTLTGSLAQAQTGDGQVLPSAWRLLGDKRLFNRLARLLVDVGLWEDRSSGDDGFQFHDWFDIGYASGEKVKQTRKRTKEMKNPDITEAVKARDGDHCRYCGRKVDWKDRHGDIGATYDHVIPGLAAGVTNLVVACRKCNRKKAQRTPEQAGMRLLPPPHGPDSDQTSLVPDQTISSPTDQRSGAPLKTRSKTRSGPGPDPADDEDPAEVAVEVAGPAGRPPPVPPSPGHTGSPWHNWQGRPPPDPTPQCPEHGLDMPCTKCTAGHYRDEGDNR